MWLKGRRNLVLGSVGRTEVSLSREVENSEDFRSEKEFKDKEEKVAMMKRFKNLRTVVTELKRRKQSNCREIDYMLVTGK